MRRTYRSKKDAGGALDHRDILYTMDAKSSVFDAFYIQNIKQAKRELSCIGSSTQHIPSNKVRKRKYVKRVKEIEMSPKESIESAYLTPDKSIHVKKAPDLFDQLLNSSVQSSKVEDGFTKQCKVEEKTYCRKKLAKARHFNNSSSDSTESDKENSDQTNTTHDMSDIKSHKLLIEKENKARVKCFDDSIHILEKLPLFNNNHESFNNQSDENNKSIQNRNLSNQNSPLCSTPFLEKYRGKSIYRFSPIAFNLNDSSKNISTQECQYNPEQRKSKFHINKDETDLNVKDSKTNNEDCINNMLTHKLNDCPELKESVGAIQKHSIDYDEIDVLAHATKKVNSINLLDVQTSPIINLNMKSMSKSHSFLKASTNEEIDVKCSYIEASDIQNNYIEKDVIEESNNEVIINETSSLQMTELEPFFGFSDKIINKTEQNVVDNVNINELKVKNADNVNNSEMLFDLTETSNKSESISECSIKANKSDSPSESQSLYDTCSEDNSFDSSETREPVIVIERMNNSLFQKYYKQMFTQSDSSVNLDSDNNTSDEYASIYEIISSENTSHEHNTDSDSDNIKDEVNENFENNIISNNVDLEKDDEKCVSFVTTRRRNEVANDSFIFLDDSYNSSSSTDVNKTVLSNNKRIFEDGKTFNDISPQSINKPSEENLISVNGSNVSESDIKTYESEKDRIPNITRKGSVIPKVDDESFTNSHTEMNENRISSITIRKSSRATSSDASLVSNSILCDSKPAIVLQPGKKWERSLSIYRRMTTMGDHFDESLLDDESLQTKGRKYRQSVISTMGMQEHGVSLHNESNNSRRSTFVSKPSRSTIKIVKESNVSRPSLCATILDDLTGFLTEDCDDTLVELSKLSIGDSEHEVTVLEKFHDSNRVTTARDYVLRRCNQTDAILFDECYPDTVLKNCHKIGEGVYGEVFLWRAGDGRARVMKIIPIAGTIKVNGEQQKDYNEIISEIVIAMELSALRAPIADIERHFDEGKGAESLDLHSVENATDVFNEVLAVRCLYGGYPSRLLDLWDLYDECKGSENDNPAVLPLHQQYIVLELANAGQDLESYQFNNAEQAYALFLQVAYGLAVAEEAYQFEHRDLHWGNVLISPTDQKFATFVLRGRAHRVARRGVAATVIDYSLSRVSLAAGGERAALYNDLAADDALFDAVGDYQFHVYRLMRERLGNDWKNFEPYTNILWLHYTVDKMITALRYSRTNTKIHKHYIAKLKEIKNRILNYDSAALFVLTDNEI